MAALNLFPSHVAFVDREGKLTSEAYRTLQSLYQHVGGSFGDQGVDIFQPESDGVGIHPITPTGSPFSFMADRHGMFSFQEGPTTKAVFSRGGVSVDLGIISGLVQMRAGDTVTITYEGTPIMNFIPK